MGEKRSGPTEAEKNDAIRRALAVGVPGPIPEGMVEVTFVDHSITVPDAAGNTRVVNFVDSVLIPEVKPKGV